jgi:Zn finger protein HypA/HybF involved in hydrogenase expression
MERDHTVAECLKSPLIKLHYKTRKKIIELSKIHKNLHIETEYRIFRCRNCFLLSDKLVVQVFLEDRLLHETKFKCANCQTGLKHTNLHSLKYAICPKCKSNKFRKEKELVLWN